jgi:ferric-dicitrate binding protein FerR (iron transport regulator)
MSPSEKDKQYFYELLSKYNNGTATTSETEFVEKFLAIMEHRKTNVLAGFDEEKYSLEKEMEDRLLQTIRREPGSGVNHTIVHRVHFLRRAGWWAAAAAIIVMLTGTAYWLLNKKSQQPVAVVAPANDVQPGRQGAYLTLADGRKILLDSLGNGIVADEAGAQVVLQDGQLSYKKLPIADSRLTYNTISTPKGRQFTLQLPDGSKVWLNAASSLKYPVVFAGTERRVEITGEAYFEVTKNKNLPFIVGMKNNTTVEVLGTHFNVNAYNDEEAIKTTLLEGRVKVKSAIGNRQSAILKPGEQAVIAEHSPLTIDHSPNLEQVIAWKNGTFSFTNASLETVMRQLARWYNIEIEFVGSVPGGTFSGEIDRSLTLDQVLKGLTKTRVHYTIQKDKLLIQP